MKEKLIKLEIGDKFLVDEIVSCKTPNTIGEMDTYSNQWLTVNHVKDSEFNGREGHDFSYKAEESGRWNWHCNHMNIRATNSRKRGYQILP